MSLINREKLCVNREKSAPKIHHFSPLVFHRLRPHDSGVGALKIRSSNGFSRPKIEEMPSVKNLCFVECKKRPLMVRRPYDSV